jgi:hypothetical protein
VTEYDMLRAIFWLAVAGVSMLVAILILKVVIYLRVIGQLENCRDLLLIVKDHSNSARINRKEAVAALRQVKVESGTHPTRADVLDAVQQIPDRTAEKVTEAIKSGDSGVVKP